MKKITELFENRRQIVVFSLSISFLYIILKNELANKKNKKTHSKLANTQMKK